jgi:tetratricopeptide (TPR) repeat protein
VLTKPVRSALIVCLATYFCNSAKSVSQEPTTTKPETTAQILDRINRQAESGGMSDPAYEELGRIVEKEPNNARAHLLLGRGYEMLGLPEQAYEQFSLALKYGLNTPSEIVLLIKALAKSGHMKSAQQLVDEAVQRFPNDPEIKFWEGNFLYSRNKVSQAEEKYAEALKGNKPILGLYSALASIRFTQQRYEMALQLALKDLATNPNYVLANEVAGLSYVQLKRYSEAVEPMHKAFTASPMKNMISQAYAKALYWTGDYANALRPALVNLAFTSDLYSYNAPSKRLLEPILRHVTRKQLIEKIDEVSKHLGIAKNAAFHFCLADVLDRYGFRDIAMEQYRAGLDLQPKFPRGWYRLGLDLENYKRDYAGALSCLRTASALQPQDEEIAKHLLRLEDRLPTYKTDWSWQFKDWLRSLGLNPQ